MDVYEQINGRLGSPFSVDRYMGSSKWDKMKKDLRALTPEGTVAIQVAGRFDIASQAIYDNPMLDWILLVYNGFKKIGYEEGRVIKHSLTLTLAVGQEVLEDVGVMSTNADVLYSNSLIPIISGYVDLDGLGDNALKFTYHDQGITAIKNISDIERTFTVVYALTEYSDELGIGTLVSYPGITDVSNLLSRINAEERRATAGFARL